MITRNGHVVGFGAEDILGPEFVRDLEIEIAIVALSGVAGAVGGKLIGDRVRPGIGGIIGAVIGGIGVGAVAYFATEPAVVRTTSGKS